MDVKFGITSIENFKIILETVRESKTDESLGSHSLKTITTTNFKNGILN